MKTLSKVLFILLFFSFTAGSVAQHPEISPMELGTKAHDFDLPGIDGKNYTLADFDEYEVLAIVFWANHCPTAQAYEDRLIALVDEFGPKGVGFAVISPNSPDAISLSQLGYSDVSDTMEDMKLRAEDKGYNFPYLYDGDDHAASIPYGPVATPHVFIFDEERTLRYRGRIDDTENPYIEPGTSDMRDAIKALLAGREIEVKQTPAFGCSIKWKWDDAWARQLEQEWAEAPVSVEAIDVEGIKELVANDSEKLRLINVWATWCGPCVIEFPYLVEMDRMYRGRDFEFISLSVDEPNTKQRVLRFLENQEASNKNYLFDSRNKYDLIEAVDPKWEGALPHTILVAPGGELVARYVGAIDPLTVRRDIIEYLGRYFADD
ncbi:redoxin domain-containing protein [Balneolaceae bacterium ANBcel3]|nr:redoxin domain-containing protein [Balneolaceae bacterium ANBcel3]